MGLSLTVTCVLPVGGDGPVPFDGFSGGVAVYLVRLVEPGGQPGPGVVGCGAPAGRGMIT